MSWTISQIVPSGRPLKIYAERRWILQAGIVFSTLAALVMAAGLAYLYRNPAALVGLPSSLFLLLYLLAFFLGYVPALIKTRLRLADGAAVFRFYESGLYIDRIGFIPWENITDVAFHHGHSDIQGDFIIRFDCPRNHQALPCVPLNFDRRMRVKDGQLSYNLMPLFMSLYFKESLHLDGVAVDLGRVAHDIRQHCPHIRST